jgi:GntR family transcriptional regulator, transcriptional repressor for pyruvate dehydrogenase complex
MNAPQRPPWDLDDQIEKPVTSSTRKLADILFAEIVDGVHSYGTRLPAERALTEQYGLSRNTIRQALGLMEHYGVIRRRVGSGSVVCYRIGSTATDATPAPAEEAAILDLGVIGEITSPLELGVVRSIVEPEIARLAVINMTSRDIQRLNEIQNEIDLVSVDGEKFSALDEELRMQIAKGTHNPLLIAIYTMVNHVNRTADWAEQRRKALTPIRIKEYCLQSRSLCEAIESRNIETAVEYLKISLAEFHQDLMRGA